jgi:SPP1 gp7 family putative phage head morphogenesis protein
MGYTDLAVQRKLPAGFEFESMPPEQAMAYFRALGITPTWDYRELWGLEQRRAFTVAKLTQLDLLEKVHDLIDDAIAKGTSLFEFQEALTDELTDAGWGGKAISTRLENIYRTNLATAYAAGEDEQLQESAQARAARGLRTLWTYQAVGDTRTRETHQERAGTTLPAEDAWWGNNRPPIDFCCRCWVDEETDMSRETERPDIPNVTYRNPQTGEEISVPRGVQPGFGTRNWDSAVGDELRRRLAQAKPEIRRAVARGIDRDKLQPRAKKT